MSFTHRVMPPSLVERQEVLTSRLVHASGDDAERAITRWQELLDSEFSSGRNLVFDAAVAEMERQLLPLVMKRCGGSQVKAARVLGITRSSLRKKLRQLGLVPPSSARSR
jgi:DNA-binding protein Fis